MKDAVSLLIPNAVSFSNKVIVTLKFVLLNVMKKEANNLK